MAADVTEVKHLCGMVLPDGENCKLKFTKNNLNKHRVEMHGPPKFKCDVGTCTKVFKRKQPLVVHQMNCGRATTFVCLSNKCEDTTYTTPNSLRDHYRRVHPNGVVQVQTSTVCCNHCMRPTGWCHGCPSKPVPSGVEVAAMKKAGGDLEVTAGPNKTPGTCIVTLSGTIRLDSQTTVEAFTKEWTTKSVVDMED